MKAKRSGRGVVAFAAAIRLLVVVWGTRFPPAADGTYYDTLARRIASGAGYTWLWPDGAVTPVAHYPVGYPALVALAYRLVAPSPVVPIAFAGVLGTFAVVAAFRLLAPFGPRVATVGAFLLAIHPALLLYIPALMTEGVTTSLLVIAAAMADVARSEERRGRARATRMVLGVLLAALVYLRPQNLAAGAVSRGARRAGRCAGAASRQAARDGGAAPGRGALHRAVDGAQLCPDGQMCIDKRQWRMEPAHRGRDHQRRLASVADASRMPDRVVGSGERRVLRPRRPPQDFRRSGGVAGPRARKARCDFRLFWRGAVVPPRVSAEGLRRTKQGAAGHRRDGLQSSRAPRRTLRRRALPRGFWRSADRAGDRRSAFCVHVACNRSLPRAGRRLHAARFRGIRRRSRSRDERGLGVALFVTAVVIGLTAAVHLVFFGAGRYGLPVAAFVPLIAALALVPRRAAREPVAERASIA